MPTEILTPELIRAAFVHKNARVNEIETAMDATRPNCSATASVFMGAGGEFTAYAEFQPQIRGDGRPKWGTQRKGADLDNICDQVLADIAAYKADMFGTDLERMALAIIQIKHRDGTVTDRALRMANFTQEAIEQIHERAALLANEMSDGKPFEVEFVGAGNHAEAV
jgi:hypothetical protein